MTEQEYRDCGGVRRSELWLLNPENGGSPEKYMWFKEHPEPETPALIFGRVVHKLLLEHQDFFSEFCITPKVDRRTKAGRDQYDAFIADIDGRTQISAEMYRQALEMTMKAMGEPFVKTLITGRHEVPITWTDEETSVKCKARIDCLTETDEGLCIVDYKTTRNASVGAFNNSIFRYGYHLQAGMYCEGVKNALGLTEWPQFKIIAQETKAPYSVNRINIPKEVIASGYELFRELIGIYRDCTETGYWYGYNGAFDMENEAYLPRWMQMGVPEDDE